MSSEKPATARKAWWTHITLEPTYTIFFFLENTSYYLHSNLFLQKACRPSYHGAREPNLSIPCEDQSAGISYVATINSMFRSTDLALAILFTAFATNWSDRAGRRRRPLIFLPVIAMLLEVLFGCIFSYFWRAHPIYSAWMQFLLHVFSGGRALMFLAGNMYMSDITNIRDRTYRVGILTLLRFLTIPCSNAITGFSLKKFGFFYSFLFCCALSVVGLYSTAVFVRDISVPIEKSLTFLEALNPTRMIESIKIIFRPRLQSRRAIIVILLILNYFVTFSKEGEYSIFYIYLRHRFQWDEVQYGLYAAYQNIGMIVGLMFSLMFLSRYLQVHDGIIGTFAGFWDSIAALCYVFATKNWQLYTIPLLDIFHGAAFIVVKSFLTKIVDTDELGHLSTVTALSLLFVSVNQVCYNTLFNLAKDTFPSSIFLISVAVDVPVALLYGVAYYLCRKNRIANTVEDKSIEFT